MSEQSEFSRLVLLTRLGTEPYRQVITAGESERAALARRLGLLALERLSATVELVRRGADLVLLRAAFDAAFVQECVVTLDPVPGEAAEEFELLYGPPEAEEGAAGPVEDAVAFEPLVGDAIDIGEAVAQEFSLALPPFPRSPAAVAADLAAEAAVEPLGSDDSGGGAFAALGRLLRRRDDEGP
jgi:uncharacterized metal-binding protein YceD (DUF177 family)